MANLQQIKQIAAQLYLNLDNPQSVRQQLKRINKSQTQLRQLKQEVNAKLKNLNQPNNDFGLDEAAAIGLHLFGKHRIAREVTRQGNRIERQERKQQKNARQPHIKMSNLIDNYIFEGDRLKTMAQNYLKEQSK
ncbi:MAG: hypothetical protein ACFCAD_09185 [Pleurocapsa sp.]